MPKEIQVLGIGTEGSFLQPQEEDESNKSVASNEEDGDSDKPVDDHGRNKHSDASKKRKGKATSSNTAKKPHGPTSRKTLIKRLPCSVKSCVKDEWSIIAAPNTTKFRLYTEAEYADEFESERCIQTFINFADNMEQYLRKYDLPNEPGYPLLALFSDAAEEIAKHTTKLLVKDGMDRMSKDQFLEWIANQLICNGIKLPTEKAYAMFMYSLETKHTIRLLKPERYTAILCCLHGFPQSGRFGGDDDEDVRFQRKNLLRCL